MTLSIVKNNEQSIEDLAGEFLKQSQGKWKSQRRYYTLNKDIEPIEVVSFLEVKCLAAGAKELIELARSHQLQSDDILKSGFLVSWESQYIKETRKPSIGATVFGLLGNKLYRDRGFATSSPVTAILSFTNPQTMCLRTEYGGSVFEEEVKLIGTQYRTRQTIISRAGEQITIGQYLEERIA
ncbi:MAG: phycobiliprotein lyase [Prochloraceae cyanobacterium]|nr:phycobiliprotein lyase [Prochloraceae cyanobacterium]